jgi:hypothetical protein
MMGIWIYPLSIQKTGQSDFRVYPTTGSGIFRFSFEGSVVPDNIKLSVYSMKGTKILASGSENETGNSIDLSSFPNGEYIVVLSDKTTTVSSSRIIKIQ